MTKGGKTTWSPVPTLGVRKVSNHPSGVRIAGRIGCTSPLCWLGRSFGSSLDFIPASMLQIGTRWIATCPAISIKIMPMGMIKISKVQSRRSRVDVGVVIGLSPVVSRQAEKQKTCFLGELLHYIPDSPPKSVRRALPQCRAQLPDQAQDRPP